MSNCTDSASPAQFEILVEKGMINALGGVLEMDGDARLLSIALGGLQNILEHGDEHQRNEQGENKFALAMDQEGYALAIVVLQAHKNHEVYQLAEEIVENHFPMNEDDLFADIHQTAETSTAHDPNNATMPTNASSGFFSI